ncbi:MAG: hypothetical protein JSU64_03255 [candidate division WOR-3 bacterium]|nr:MAG: hypothetical protein JSU64_03255 [candidate division WOR-3 bacterium]
MNIEVGSNRIAAVAAVIILFATIVLMNSWRGITAGLFLALIGYGFVYFASIWILKGFIKEGKVNQQKSESVN